MPNKLSDAEQKLRLAQRLAHLGMMLNKHGRDAEKAAKVAAKRRDPVTAKRLWLRVGVSARAMEIYATELVKVSKKARIRARS